MKVCEFCEQEVNLHSKIGEYIVCRSCQIKIETILTGNFKMTCDICGEEGLEFNTVYNTKLCPDCIEAYNRRMSAEKEESHNRVIKSMKR